MLQFPMHSGPLELQVLKRALMINQMVPLLLSLENVMSMFSKKNFKFCLTTKQFSNLSRSILNALWPREDGVSGLCSHMASLHGKALICVCGCHSQVCSQTIPEPMQ